MPRACIVSPFLTGTARGNATQAHRKAKLLRETGWEVSMVELSSIPTDPLRPKALRDAILAGGRPDVVIAIHALHSREVVPACAELALPLVTATGGTDVNPGLTNPGTCPDACQSFAGATRILAQSRHQQALIAQH